MGCAGQEEVRAEQRCQWHSDVAVAVAAAVRVCACSACAHATRVRKQLSHVGGGDALLDRRGDLGEGNVCEPEVHSREKDDEEKVLDWRREEGREVGGGARGGREEGSG